MTAVFQWLLGVWFLPVLVVGQMYNIPDTTYYWVTDKPVEARFTLTCGENTDLTLKSCVTYSEEYKTYYDGSKGLYPKYVLKTIDGTDYPDLTKNYTDLTQWLPFSPSPSWGCTYVSVGKMCTRLQTCVLNTRYYGTVRKHNDNSLIGEWFDLQDDRVWKKDRYYGGGPDARCNLCTIQRCGGTTCKNGEYSDPPGLKSIDGVIIAGPVCKACPAGYWLTCSSVDSDLGCTYLPPSDTQWDTRTTTGKMQWISKNRNTVPPTDITMKNSSDWPILMGQCYPCATARKRLHYGTQAPDSSDDLFNQGFLTFTCPGGALPPLACPPHEMSKFDPVTKAATTCDCMHGYYRKDGVCAPCEAGNYCVSGAGKVRCADDHYSLAGSSTCTPCARNVNICPENEALTRCITGFQDKDSYCVDCGTCQQLWSGDSASVAVPCYRLSSVGT